MARSFDGGATFPQHFTVTDKPWDPTIDAPWSHGDPNVTFIGDYFGLDASIQGFYPVWTDTRTGIQELWTDIVPDLQAKSSLRTYDLVGQILGLVAQDGGGYEIVGGHISPIPPWGPERDILLGLAINRIAALVSSREGIALQKGAMNLVVRVAQQEIRRLEGLDTGNQHSF
jgi:hypothetical protein